MTAAVDTNVFVSLWDKDQSVNSPAQSALDNAWSRGNLVVCAPVFAELLAFPGRSEEFLSSFFSDTGITVEWSLDEATWRAAGRAFQAHVSRRRKQRDLGARRILADFLIGAHAFQNGYKLLTLDEHLYRAAFPRLSIISI